MFFCNRYCAQHLKHKCLVQNKTQLIFYLLYIKQTQYNKKNEEKNETKLLKQSVANMWQGKTGLGGKETIHGW